MEEKRVRFYHPLAKRYYKRLFTMPFDYLIVVCACLLFYCILYLITNRITINWDDFWSIFLFFILFIPSFSYLSILIFYIYETEKEENYVAFFEDSIKIDWHFFSVSRTKILFEEIEAIKVYPMKGELKSKIFLKDSSQVKDTLIALDSVPIDYWKKIAKPKQIPLIISYELDFHREYDYLYNIRKDLKDNKKKIPEEQFLEIASQSPQLVFKGQTEAENTNDPRILG